MIDEDSDIDDDVALILEKVQRSSALFANFCGKDPKDIALIACALAEMANQAAYTNTLKALELMILMEDDDDDEDDEIEDEDEA